MDRTTCLACSEKLVHDSEEGRVKCSGCGYSFKTGGDVYEIEEGWVMCDSPIGEVPGWDTLWHWRATTVEYRVDAVSKKRWDGLRFSVRDVRMYQGFINGVAIDIPKYLAYRWNERAERTPQPA